MSDQQMMLPGIHTTIPVDQKLPFEVRMTVWRTRRERLKAVASRIRKANLERAERIWKEAFGSSLPPSNCVHNAAIDANLTGWCKTRKQLRAAKQADALINDWTTSQIANRGSNRIWSQLFPNNFDE